jgi:hypothetical protein
VSCGVVQQRTDHTVRVQEDLGTLGDVRVVGLKWLDVHGHLLLLEPPAVVQQISLSERRIRSARSLPPLVWLALLAEHHEHRQDLLPAEVPESHRACSCLDRVAERR